MGEVWQLWQNTSIIVCFVYVCVCVRMCACVSERESTCMCECSASTAFVRQTNLDSKTELAYNATVLANSSSELPQNTRELPHNTMELTYNITAYFQLNLILSSMKNGVSPHHAIRKQLLIVSNHSVGHETGSLLKIEKKKSTHILIFCILTNKIAS